MNIQEIKDEVKYQISQYYEQTDQHTMFVYSPPPIEPYEVYYDFSKIEITLEENIKELKRGLSNPWIYKYVDREKAKENRARFNRLGNYMRDYAYRNPDIKSFANSSLVLYRDKWGLYRCANSINFDCPKNLKYFLYIYYINTYLEEMDGVIRNAIMNGAIPERHLGFLQCIISDMSTIAYEYENMIEDLYVNTFSNY